MKSNILSRLDALEEIAQAAKKADAQLSINISNTRIKICSLSTTGHDVFEAATPLEAVEAVETHILKKMPDHVIMSYGFDDLFDLYPEWREAFAEFAPVPCANLTVGDYYKSMENLSLKHLILFNHVHTWGHDTMMNREKGIVCTDADFQAILPSEAALFEALRDILTKEAYWRENSGRFVPDTPGRTTGYMKFGKWATQNTKI